ncbi:MAG: dTDP-4-dehydrorhamnose reductase [Desulfotalea sp.]
MKILLLGKNGQLGYELQRSLATLGEVVACGHNEADFENLSVLQDLIRKMSPQVIVNAAAYTAVDRAESEVDRASIINTKAVDLLAKETSRLDAWLIHYSTDYVFDGTKKNEGYSETDITSPLSVYGQTKLAGEEAIRASGCKHLIFRTSWVYAARGNNFIKTMLSLAHEQPELKVVFDQIGAPTSAELIADTTALCLYYLKTDKTSIAELSGLYHLVASGATSWHGFAQFIINEATRHGIQLCAKSENILPIPTSEYPLPAPRPANSRLTTQKINNTFKIELPPWEVHAKRIVAEIVSNNELSFSKN